MQDAASYKLLMLLSTVITWTILGVMLTKWPGGKSSMSISQHAAMYKKVHILYAIALSTAQILLVVFMFGWFIPNFNLPVIFAVILIIGTGLEFIATWVAETGGLKRKIHRICAYIAAALMPALLLLLLISLTVSTKVKAVVFLAVGFLLFCWFLFFFVKKSHERYLWYQSGCVVALQLAILAVVYIH